MGTRIDVKRAIGALLLVGLGIDCDCGDGGLGVLTPDIEASPSPLSFGVAYVGIGATRPLAIENRGGAPLKVDGLRVAEGTHPGVAVQTESFTLGPGEEHAVLVTFVPEAVGPAYGSILIDSDDPDEPTLEVPIEGSGERRPGPVISVCVGGANLTERCVLPLRIDFGQVPFGQTREATVTIASVGTESLELLSAAFEMGAHPSITIDPQGLSGTIPVNDSRIITVRFSPTVPEEVTAVLQITSDDPERSFVPVIITGSGIAPTLCLSEQVLDFGRVAIGDFAERTVNLESCGEVAFDITALEIVSSTEFSIQTAPALPSMLAPGDTADVTLRYAPVDAGRDMDQMRIRSTVPDGFVSLIGEAAACDLVVTPNPVSFNAVASGASRTRTALLENSGGIDCTISDIQLGAGTTSEFRISSAPQLPAILLPGNALTVDVDYTPADAGSDMGTLEIASDDPTEPSTIVQLSGRRLGIGECALDITPDPITYGLVPLGSSATMQVAVQNVGTNLCTLSQLRLSLSSSRDFSMVPPSFPILIPGGQSRSYPIVYTPRTAAPQTGELDIFTGLIPLNPDYLVPISGAGSGPELCVTPDPLVFGTHTIGLPITRQLQMSACGTENVVVSALAFPPPTSAEYSLPSSPSLPFTLTTGTQRNLDVGYTGVDMGRDDGLLRITSNDAIEPSQDVQLIAHSSNAPCGDLQGRLCGLDGAGPVSGGTVYVDTPAGRVQATTNTQGDWVLTCVPAGTWQVVAEQGSWSTRFTANVQPGSLTTIPGQQCLDPSSASVAVVWGEWDQMEGVLDAIGIPYTFYQEVDEAALINDPAELARYDIVFLNCGWNELLALGNPGLTNIIDFVDNGGSIYASDWAYDVVEVGWPSYVDFVGDDNVRDAAQNAGHFSGLVDVVEPGLINALGGRTWVPIESCCTAMLSTGPNTTVYLQGDRLNDGGTHPFMVGFQPGPTAGRVIYTDFHNSGQPDIDTVFNWLILQL